MPCVNCKFSKLTNEKTNLEVKLNLESVNNNLKFFLFFNKQKMYKYTQKKKKKRKCTCTTLDFNS